MDKEKYLKEVLQKTRDLNGIPTYSAFGDGNWFYTAKPISWKPDDGDDLSLAATEVPIGFVTDLASVPKPFWSLMPRDGVYLAAAIIHDFNYWFQTQTRQQSDEIFDLGMRELKVPFITRKTIYHSVRIGGHFSWANNQKLKSRGEKRILTKFPDKPTIRWENWKRDESVFA